MISIYSSGLLLGIALVAFPAASTILTDPNGYNFTHTQYGSLFIPQSILSIAAALLNSIFCSHLGAKRTLTIGLMAAFVAMTLLTLSNFNHSYGMLLVATGCLGIGFGLAVPTINRMAEKINPAKSDNSVLTLNALLGVGTTLSPIFVALFSKMGFWWGLPLSISLALIGLMIYNLKIDLPEESRTSSKPQSKQRSRKLITIFITFAFLYGIIETLNGNWLSIYMSKELHASITIQSIALAAFWGMVTFGRIFISVMSKYFSKTLAFQIAPFISTVAFLIISFQFFHGEYWSIIAFGLMGFGCSVMLPLFISFGGKLLPTIASSVPGMIISFYLLGYGVAAFGVGPLEQFGHITLRSVYAIGAVVSFILGILSLYTIYHGKKRLKNGS